MNKNHWNKVIFDNTVSDELIYQWIDSSYKLVVKNLTQQLELNIL